MNQYSGHVAFILVEPENPENIGAVARAIKNMGFTDLRMINPPKDWFERGKKLAPHAEDVLSKAAVFERLTEAIADIHWTFGSTRRMGPRRGTFLAFPKAAQEMREAMKKQKIALVFGKESKGLDNDSLNLCDWVTSIPTDAACPSINLAQAVMVMAFTLTGLEAALPTYMHRGKLKMRTLRELEYLPKEQVQDVLARLEKSMIHLGYKHGDKSCTADRIKQTWQRIFKRSGLLDHEAQMLRGLSRRILERVVLPPISNKRRGCIKMTDELAEK